MTSSSKFAIILAGLQLWGSIYGFAPPPAASGRSKFAFRTSLRVKEKSRSMTITKPASTKETNEKKITDEWLRLRIRPGITVEQIEPETYEAQFIEMWDSLPKAGFDWEMEKLRRKFAGIRQADDGTWVKKDGVFDFLAVQRHLPSRNDMMPAATFFDASKVIFYNILAMAGLGPSLGMASVPTAVIQKYEGSFLTFITGVLGGDLQTLAGGPLFLLLAKYYEDYGPIFYLSFGPKSFLIVNDPVMAKYILKSPVDAYDKGVLAEILEPIMGNGLIPANPETWKVRRRAIVPGFHKKWLNRMIQLFGECTERLVADLENTEGVVVVDMEEKFCSVTLDIIGNAVFNYDFDSVTKESPIVKAVYRTLREAEHRATSFIPYWNLPYANKWMSGQVKFRHDMEMLDDILADLINRALLSRKEATVEELEERENAEDPSLLRFLVDMRGEDLSSKQLRDDLMTMLIAGHETTAAVLTWTLFELSSGDSGLLDDVRDEIDRVMGDRIRPNYDDLVQMKKLRYCLIEALRLYPEPPVLIRRSRKDDVLPPGGSGFRDGIKVLKGTDIFISAWNLHRSEELWENAAKYDPTRWERKFLNKGVTGWEGMDPEKERGIYPNEVSTDYSFLPFGGGQRKCVGDQFAFLEATVTMSMMLKNFDFKFVGTSDDVGMKTGATIHTLNGLNMILSKRPPRKGPVPPPSGWWESQHTKRGLGPDGRPFENEEDATWSTAEMINMEKVNIHAHGHGHGGHTGHSGFP
mmetsp:Transcript_49319/g.96462  ORF Transcript_49319/g.96462 Transcript_49319/m.96462 type:complete len:751 (-) Transcript_49319:123-2375(-)